MNVWRKRRGTQTQHANIFLIQLPPQKVVSCGAILWNCHHWGRFRQEISRQISCLQRGHVAPWKKAIWLASPYEQPGILGSGISVPLFTEIFATKMRLAKQNNPPMPHLESHQSGIPAEIFWFTTIEGLTVLTKATPSIDTFADMFPLLLQVEVYYKSTSTLRLLGEWRNSFQHSTAKKIIGSFWSLLLFLGWKRCKWFDILSFPNQNKWANSWKCWPRTRSITSPRPYPYPKLIWNQQRSNVLGFGCLVFLLNTGWFSASAWHKSTASPGHRSLNPSLPPLDKPRVVTFMINTCRVKDTKNQQRDMISYSILSDTCMKSLLYCIIQSWCFRYKLEIYFPPLARSRITLKRNQQCFCWKSDSGAVFFCWNAGFSSPLMFISQKKIPRKISSRFSPTRNPFKEEIFIVVGSCWIKTSIYPAVSLCFYWCNVDPGFIDLPLVFWGAGAWNMKY